MAAWAWIPIVIWAAVAQTIRNAAQRSLVTELGTLSATLVRFLYGLPFAVAWLTLLITCSGAHPALQMVVNRSYLQVRGLERTKRPLHLGQ